MLRENPSLHDPPYLTVHAAGPQTLSLYYIHKRSHRVSFTTRAPLAMSGGDSPTFFHGQPWSSWIERIGRDKPLSKCAQSDRKVACSVLRFKTRQRRASSLVPNLISMLLCPSPGTLTWVLSTSLCTRVAWIAMTTATSHWHPKIFFR